MKKFISIMLCVCICLSSTVLCFADFTSTDSTTLSNIYKNMPTSSQLNTLNSKISTISTTLSTISNRTLDIYNALFVRDHSIAYWVESINSWMSPIYGRLADIITNTLNIESVAGLLGKTETVNGTTIRTPYLFYKNKSVGEYEYELYRSLANVGVSTASPWSNDFIWRNAHSGLNLSSSGKYNFYSFDDTGNVATQSVAWWQGTPLGNIAVLLRFLNYSTANEAYLTLGGVNNNQSAVNWLDLSSSSFTPSSLSTGLYGWLSNIQAPVARLSYVLASDERIEAQEKAAENEQAVVDNFIDSSGSGAASSSDFGSVSNLSSGFKNNISTDASVSGIWNIFNSDNFGWFSQETANQLDTTGSSSRTLRSSGSYPTPLLDQQTEDIMKILGGDDND